jgi:sugar lactone lactonase YvrE
VTTLAGSTWGYADGTGTSAQFYSPDGITTDGTNLYVADTYNNRIRKIVISTAEVSTLAGSSYGYADGTGSGAQFAYPSGITTDGTNLYVADTYNNRIRKIVISTAEVSTLAGSSYGYADGTGSGAQFAYPSGITTDGTNLYVADTGNGRIRKIVISTGEVTTLAGSSYGYADGTGIAAQFYNPYDITTEGTNLYVSDMYNHRIRKIVISTGEVTTLAGSSEGHADGTGTSAQFDYPRGITTDGTNLYVADTGNGRIRKIVISTGEVTTLAGSSYGYADGNGTAAQFDYPYDITTDGINLYVTDTNNNRIRCIK